MTIAAHGIGGMQRHAHDLVRGLVEHGHDVEVVCPVSTELECDLYGARWHLVDTTGRTDSAWRRKFLDAYLTAAGPRPFDVIHSESTSAIGLLGPEVTPPIVVKYHGNYLSLAKGHLRRMRTRPRTAPGEGKALVDLTRLHFRHGNAWAFRHCQSIVVSRQQLKDTAASHFIPRSRVHVVPNGVDASLFSPGRDDARQALGLPAGVPLMVAVGRLNREKGFDVAIRAHARLDQEMAHARLIIVGDGEERASLARLASEVGVSDRVDFVGGQPHERVADFMRAADVFVFPTLRDEAAPLVLPQAMACGIAVVASEIGGIPEVLEDGGDGPAGVLIETGSVGALHRSVRALLADRERRESLGERARARILDGYTITHMVDRTVDVYRLATREPYLASAVA